MNDGHKTHEPPGRTPQQITDAIAQSDIALTINRTGNLLHRFDVRKQRLELYLLAIGLGSSPCLAAFLPRGGSIGHRVGFDPGHEMVALLEQAVHHLAGGVVGIGDKVEGSLDSQDIEQAEHLVEQGALVAIGPYQTFVDAHGERHGEEALGRVYEQADSLHGMPHDVFGLGVGFRLLMQELDGRHFLAALGGFDAVPDQDQPAIDPHGAWEQLQHSLRPQGRKPVELDAAAVKVIEQLGVEPGPQVQGAHDAGDAEQFHPHRQAGHGGDEPHEGTQAREGRPQQKDCIPPDTPQR